MRFAVSGQREAGSGKRRTVCAASTVWCRETLVAHHDCPPGMVLATGTSDAGVWRLVARGGVRRGWHLASTTRGSGVLPSFLGGPETIEHQIRGRADSAIGQR